MTDEELRALEPGSPIATQFSQATLAWMKEQRSKGLPTSGQPFADFRAAWQPEGAEPIKPASALPTTAETGVYPANFSGTTTATGFPIHPDSKQGAFRESVPPITGQNTAAYKTNMEGAIAESDKFNNAFEPRDDLTEGVSGGNNRLMLIRPRSTETLYKGGAKYTSDRGTICKIRLLKNPDYDLKAATQGFRSDISKQADQLVSTSGFTDIFITGFQANYSEKTQIMTTFGDNEVVYYFGKQPIQVSITGFLFDAYENDWFSRFMTLYAEVLRGTQLARNFCLVEITFPSMVMTGTIAGLSTGQQADRDTDVSFSMQFIAKDVVPLPVQIQNGSESAITGQLVDFKATREGVKSYTIGKGTLGGGFMESVKAVEGFFNQTIGTAASVGQAINSFRTSIFTPVFGVISSITKIVKTATGSISKIISSFTNPVNQVLRDIQSIATRASALAVLVESSVHDLISIPARTIANLRNTIGAIKGAAGTIARVPENIAQSLQRLHSVGRVRRGAAILSSGKTRKKSKAAVLGSGVVYNPVKSNTL